MSQEAIELLSQIRDHLASIDRNIASLVARRRASEPKPIASDRDLDGQHGNPVVKFNPRDWTGASCKGRRMSECPAPFLDLLAQTFDYFGDQAEQKNERTNSGKPVADYKRADAARARGWAQRIRDGKVTQASTNAGEPDSSWADGESEREWASAGEGF